jgi:glyoxylase-like metal-dependent hydrolase (beta-lactamase superfamily II)
MKQKIIRIDLKGVNCYLGKEGDKFILFDTGGHTVMDKTFTDRCEILESELEKAGCKSGNLMLVVLTHGDNDHVANSVFIREKYKTKIAMHTGDLQLVENPTMEKVMRSFNYRSIIYKIIFQIMKKPIKKITNKILSDFKTFKPDVLIDEGCSLIEYGFEAKILYIPGHTEGSIGILMANGDLVAGDTFINIKKPDIAANAYDLRTLKKSVDRLKALNINTIYPGHGMPFGMNDLKQ